MARISAQLLDSSLYPFKHVITTRYADIDPNHHINNVALAAALEDARYRFDDEAGFRQSMPGLRVMIVANHIDYVAQATYPDPLDMFVGLLEIGRTSWTLACLATQEKRACAFARATLVATREGRPAPLPEAFRSSLDKVRVRLG